ncbi:RNA polymerase II transcription factor B subunit 4 [Cytospora mali]|uniref:General transcription and DNA repair factor IIH subunit TFB4 n=1 Tax=Cytospora mali TaxID=578113 RepID=A0A194UNH1_CYTMA|nr:RNA polymerase II transcription factor B subunit 4 [Valsa mali var. pyri (nom. inval.)]
MDAVDATDHYEIYATEETPSLCTIIVDTNPRAWAAVKDVLPISKALANILVFANSHLACSSTNQVAIIASHTNRAVWLYPPPPKPKSKARHKQSKPSQEKTTENGEDVEMTDAFFDGPRDSRPPPKKRHAAANKYPQFAQIESSILASLRELMSSTTESDLSTTTTQISGALTLALSHINKTSILLSATDAAQASGITAKNTGGSASANTTALANPQAGILTGLHARIVVISVSESSPAQYIPTMNAVFAASHAGIPIDILSLHGSATFLQQASYITRGTFLEATNPQGLLTYLLFGFASSIASTATVMATKTNTAGQVGGTEHGDGGGGGGAGLNQLISPSTASVDFRAACFCHRRVIDSGFVCSICLSIFCEVPQDAECLTCGNKLALGKYGAKPAVVPRRKKKKRKLGLNGEPVGSEQPGSATGTPRPG